MLRDFWKKVDCYFRGKNFISLDYIFWLEQDADQETISHFLRAEGFTNVQYRSFVEGTSRMIVCRGSIETFERVTGTKLRKVKGRNLYYKISNPKIPKKLEGASSFTTDSPGTIRAAQIAT